VAAGRLKIAIPGKFTTANLLLGLAFPQARNTTELVFSAIETAVLNDEFDAGLIIHENRFTYAARGLHKVIDLGEYWESETGCPIPLGGIAVKRTLPDEVKQAVNRVLRRSVEYAHRPLRQSVLGGPRAGGARRRRGALRPGGCERRHSRDDAAAVSRVRMACSCRTPSVSEAGPGCRM
jgi:hypothetical protein